MAVWKRTLLVRKQTEKELKVMMEKMKKEIPFLEVEGMRIRRSKAYDKNRFDKDKKDPHFKKGDLVFERENNPNNTNRKLNSKYIGSYKITEVISKTQSKCSNHTY